MKNISISSIVGLFFGVVAYCLIPDYLRPEDLKYLIGLVAVGGGVLTTWLLNKYGRARDRKGVDNDQI